MDEGNFHGKSIQESLPISANLRTIASLLSLIRVGSSVVEQKAFNLLAVGSIPTRPTTVFAAYRMIDSHCHLADTKFGRDLSDVLDRASAVGVDAFVTIADSLDEGDMCLEIARKYEQVFCTIGVHPHNAKYWTEGDALRLRTQLLSSEKVVALGEIGLDYHYDNSPRDVQQAVFAEQVQIAIDMELPIVVHNRNSIEDMMHIIRDLDPPKMVLHCCTEKWEDAKELVNRGCLLGFTGIATYPKSEDIRETIRRCPMEQIMIETDAPYLAPEGFRGKRCEPAYVKAVAECIAKTKGASLSEVDRITVANTKAFYGF